MPKSFLNILLISNCALASLIASATAQEATRKPTDSERLAQLKSQGENFQLLLKSAWIWSEKHRDDKAIEFANRAASVAKTSAQFADCAQIFMAKNEFLKAKKLAKRAIELDEHNITGWVALCHIDRTLNDFASSINAGNRALQVDPNNKEALFHRATTYMTMGKFHDAKLDADKVESQKIPLNEVEYATFAEIEYRLGNNEKAEELFKKAVRKNNNFVPPHVQLIALYGRQKRTSDAIDELTKLIKLKPTDDALFFQRAENFKNIDKVIDSLIDITMASRINPHPKNYYMRACYLDIEGRSAAAIRDCTRAIALGYTDKIAVLKLRSDCYRRLDDNKTALIDMNECVKLQPDADVYLRRYKILRSLKQMDAAIADITEAIHLVSKTSSSAALPEYYFLRGEAQSEHGRLEDALKDFEQALSLNPYDERYTNAKAQEIRKLTNHVTKNK